MKKIIAFILCLIMIASVAVMTSCNKADENDNPVTDDTASDTKDTETKDTETKAFGIETIEPVDTSKIEPAQGGDIVGEWLSDAIPYEMIEGMVANYNTRFIFNEDGTMLYTISLYSNGEIYEASYEIDGCNIIFGEGINLSNATYTVDGDILLLNSDELNVAFRRQ